MSSYKKYHADFQLVENCISSIKMQSNVLGLPKDGVTRNLNKISPKITSTDRSEDGNALYGVLTLEVAVSINKADADKIFTADIIAEGIFSASSQLGEDAFNRMLLLNGTTMLYSIVRADISAISALMFGNGQVRIPALNVLKFFDDESAEDTELPKTAD